MAYTSYTTGNALAVKLFSRALAHEVRGKTFFTQFMGEGDDNMIQIKPETGKSAGDKVTYGLRNLLTGDGIVGDSTLEGNEEALVTYSDSVLIDQLRHAVRSQGEMSEQRVPFKTREEAMMGQSDWWSERLDTILFNHLGGNLRANPTSVTGGSKTTTAFNGHNTIVAGSTGRILWTESGTTADENLDSTGDEFSLTMIDKCVRVAGIQDSDGNPRIRPVRTSVGPRYLCFIHPGQAYDLRTSTTTGQWLDIHKSILQSGVKVGDNPIFTGLLGEYNKTLIFETSYIPNGFNSTTYANIATVRRAVFAGAQAAMVAFGQKYSFDNMNWVEKRFDYDNQLGVSSRNIFGIKKTVFNSKDFASIVISSYSAV